MTPEFDKNEFRLTEAGAFDVFAMQSSGGRSWLSPDLIEKARRSAGNTVKIPVINYKDVTIRSTRPLVIPADENTSALYTVTWTTLAYGFLMYPTQYYNNDIDYQKDFNKKFKAMIVKMLKQLDTLAIAQLDTAKTQVIGEVTGGHTFASNVVSELNTGDLKSSYILADLAPMMQSNDFSDFEMDVIGNRSLQAIVARMAGFSDANTENKTLQFLGKNFHFSNRIAGASGKVATGFAVADGTCAILTRVEPDSEQRSRTRDGYEWDKVFVPGLGLEVGTYSYETAVDANAVASPATDHLTRTPVQAFDFAFDIAFLTPYNSNPATIPTPIIKFDIDTDAA